MNDKIEKLDISKMVVIPAEPMTPVQMTQYAVQHGADPKDLLVYMELQKQWEANEAKKQWNLAVANFKANAPIVTKDLKNKQFNSMYTSKGNLLNTVNPVLSEYGLNARFDLDQTNGIKVTCILTHAAGHSESTPFCAPPDTSGSKNPIQEIKSTITYGQIITFEAITGITSSEGALDDDGNSFRQPEKITADQVKKIHSTIMENLGQAGMDRFMKKIGSDLKIDDIADIPADKYGRIFTTINTIIDAKREVE